MPLAAKQSDGPRSRSVDSGSIVRAEADALRLRRAQKRYETLDLVTLDLFWRARAIQQARGPGARAAIPLFKLVIARDSKYAPAYAALAGTYGSLATPYPIAGGGAISPAEAGAEMRPLLEQALALDPDLAEGHAVQGYLHAFERRWADAEMAFRRAIDLDPFEERSVYAERPTAAARTAARCR
jgi:tetratricopeptide (TPR) repeat protein